VFPALAEAGRTAIFTKTFLIASQAMISPRHLLATGPKGAVRGLAQGKERGAALLAALCFATVLAIALGSYMTVCYRTLQMSSRSMQSTQSIELAEVGLEEALWALNNNDWSTWSINGSTATKSLTGFSFGNNTTGSVSMTITSFDGSAGTRTVTVSGTSTNPTGATITRTLTGTSAKAPLFVNAVAGTTGRVRFMSAGTVDSYDSTLGEYETQTPTYSAVLSSGYTTVTAAPVVLTNAQVKGYAATIGTSISYSTSAKLIGPSTPGTTKIDSSRISTSPYQPIFDEEPVTGSSTLLPSGSTTIGTAGATTPAIYHATEVDLNGSHTLTVDGPVVLTVTGNLYISNSAKIRITTTGSLEIHLSGDLSIGGNGIQNETKLPKNFAIIGTANENDALTMATNQAFHGVIYTPSAGLTVSNSQTIYGAIVAKSVKFTLSPTFHYDTSLRNTVFSGIETPYAISDWRETTTGN
jgi:hypothetical protein